MKTSRIVILEIKSDKYVLDLGELSWILDLGGLKSMGKGSRSQGGEATTVSTTLELWSSVDSIISSLILVFNSFGFFFLIPHWFCTIIFAFTMDYK